MKPWQWSIQGYIRLFGFHLFCMMHVWIMSLLPDQENKVITMDAIRISLECPAEP